MNQTMNAKIGPDSLHDEAFEYAAVDFLHKNGQSVEAVAAELGLSVEELRAWQRKYSVKSSPARELKGMAQLRAENEALRNEIMQLQVQWEILKTTLGVLSTTVGGHEQVG